jgi:hypothetical protein
MGSDPVAALSEREHADRAQDVFEGARVWVNRDLRTPMQLKRQSWRWLAVQLGLGLGWLALIAIRAPKPEVVAVMLLLAGWLPSVSVAFWQVQHRHWRALILSDLLASGLLVLVACSAYLPLFFFNVVWFTPLAFLPRGFLAEVLVRLANGRPKLTA